MSYFFFGALFLLLLLSSSIQNRRRNLIGFTEYELGIYVVFFSSIDDSIRDNAFDLFILKIENSTHFSHSIANFLRGYWQVISLHEFNGVCIGCEGNRAQTSVKQT